MQELFQCKLTRKGTIAPSDRQSRLRKSMANTFDTPSTDSPLDSVVIVDLHKESNILNENRSSGKVKFSHTGGTHVSSSSITNGYGTIYPPNKNGRPISDLKFKSNLKRSKNTLFNMNILRLFISILNFKLNIIRL